MKKTIFYFFVIALLPILANAQEENERQFTVGFNAGYDYYINGIRLDPISLGNEFTRGDINYNIGLDFGFKASEKLRPRLELRYVKGRYFASWDNTEYLQLHDIIRSRVDLYNFDINFHMDYLLLNTKRLDIFASPGLKWEFNMRRDCKNVMSDGSYDYKEFATYPIVDQNPINILGGTASLIFKYNISESVGITLTPEYTLFFREYVKRNTKIYQRFSTNFGLEFSF